MSVDGIGAADPTGLGIVASCKKNLVWQRITIPTVPTSQSRERPRISRQLCSPCKRAKTQEIEHRQDERAGDRSLPDREFRDGRHLLAVNAKWREASHATITRDKSKKHWLSRRLGLAWKTASPRIS